VCSAMHAMQRTYALDFLDGYVGRCGDPFHVWPDIDEDEYRVRAKAAHQVIDLIHEKNKKMTVVKLESRTPVLQGKC